jgi:hypothetical protein
VGCSSSFGGGAPSATSSCGVACEAREGPSLPAARPTQPVAAVSTGRWRNRRRGRSVARKAAPRKAVAFHAEASRLACRRREPNVNGVDVVRCPLTLKEVGSRAPRHSEERRGRRGQTLKAQVSKRVVRIGGRGSDARGACPRVVGVFAEVDRRRRTQRSARSPLHPIWKACGDGGLVYGRHASAKAPRRVAGEWASRAGSKRKPSRDRTRDRRRFAQVRGRLLPMEDTSDQRDRPHLHGGPAARSRRPQEALLVRKRSTGEWGGDRGARGTVCSGVRG